MGATSTIEWTDASWTPLRARNLETGKIGWHCEHATTACEFCYAEGMNKRLGTGLPFKPGHRKDIEIFLDETMLLAPLRWKKPRRVFVCSMTDLFADFVTDEWLDKIFAVMALTPHHTYQVLTKRPERMREYMSGDGLPDSAFEKQSRRWREIFLAGAAMANAGTIKQTGMPFAWPLPNVWLGTSCERQQEADERIPLLLQTPAAVRFISAEPLLGPIDFTRWLHDSDCDLIDGIVCTCSEPREVSLDWVIVGGESGRHARPMHPGWARKIRDDCVAAGVPYFFKQGSQSNWKSFKKFEEFPTDLKIRQFPKDVSCDSAEHSNG